TERQRCQCFAPAISIAIALLRLGARQALVAFGGAGAGIDPHDPHAEFVTVRAERSGKGRHGSVADSTRQIARTTQLAADAGQIDDHAALPRFHATEIFAAEIDIVEYLGVPARAPALFVHGFERPRGNVAGIVDQNIDIAARLRDALRGAALREI